MAMAVFQIKKGEWGVKRKRWSEGQGGMREEWRDGGMEKRKNRGRKSRNRGKSAKTEDKE
jgi:hypothetical protein